MKKQNKSIYDKLDNLKAPIDKEQTWRNIHNRDGFPTKEKKRRFFFWFFFGLGLAVLITSLALRIHSSNQLPIEKDITPLNTITAQSQSTSNSKNGETVSQELNSADNKNESALKSTESESESESELKTKIDLETKAAETKAAETKTETKTKTKTEIKIKTETAAASPVHNSRNKKPSPIVPNQPIFPAEKNSANDITIVKSISSADTTPTLALANANDQRTLNQGQSNFLPFINRKISLLPILPLSGISFFDDEEKLSFVEVSIIEKPIIKPMPWALEIGIGIGTGNHAIATDSLWAAQDFQREHTRSFVSYMLDLRLNKKLKYNFRLAAGLRYANNSRLFSYQDQSKIYTKQNLPDAANYFESTTNTTYTFYHQHHTLDLETMLIKDFTWKKTTAYVGIGLGLNTLSRFKGKGINANLEDVDLQAAGDYATNIGWQYLYEAGVSQQLNNHFYVSAAVSGKSGQDLNSRGSHRVAPVYFRVGVGRRF